MAGLVKLRSGKEPALTRRAIKLPAGLPAAPPAAARAALACMLACALATPSALLPAAAFADTSDIEAEIDAYQQQIEDTAQQYDEAAGRVEELQQQIEDNEATIEAIQAQLPEQQERTAQACRTLYQLQRNAAGLLEMLLGIESFSDFLTAMEYLTHIQESSMADIERLQSSMEELQQAQDELEQARQEAEKQQAAAEEALAAAQQARADAQQRAQEQAAAEAAEAAAEAEAQAAEEAAADEEDEADENASDDASEDADGSDDDADASSESESEAVGEAVSDDGADWTSDKTTFVETWAARIDAYLAGSALAGTGAYFAEAAWDYGVDPRWSPAIAYVESSLGAACAYSYNAWGWGSVSWSSWEEAIFDHVAGLARGYGYTISVSAAKKYCPSNWEHWYNATSAQMEKI